MTMTAKPYSIRKHIAWLTMSPLLVMVISMEAFFLHERAHNMDQELLERGHLIASQLASSSEYGLFANNQSFLSNIAESAMQQSDVHTVLILNENHVVAAAGIQPGTSASNTLSEDVSRLPALVSRDMPLLDQGDTVLLYQPILSTQIALSDFEVASSAHQVGAVIIEMDRRNTRSLQTRMVWVTVATTSLFVLLTLYFIYLASRRIIEPISHLNTAIQAIAAGNLDTRVHVPNCINELCNLGNGINQMTAELQQERAILQHRIDEATTQLRALAFYDTLTRLPNRRLLNDRLAQALSSSKRSGKYGALIFLDLDNFKPVNDRYGHAAGDALLVEAAQRIVSCVREMDTVARFGGDEFVVILGELDGNEEEAVQLAYLVAEKIRNKLGDTYHICIEQEDQTACNIIHRCSSSIGVAMFLDSQINPGEVLSWADAAMYQAKQSGRDRIIFYNATESQSSAITQLHRQHRPGQ